MVLPTDLLNHHTRPNQEGIILPSSRSMRTTRRLHPRLGSTHTARVTAIMAAPRASGRTWDTNRPNHFSRRRRTKLPLSLSMRSRRDLCRRKGTLP